MDFGSNNGLGVMADCSSSKVKVEQWRTVSSIRLRWATTVRSEMTVKSCTIYKILEKYKKRAGIQAEIAGNLHVFVFYPS